MMSIYMFAQIRRLIDQGKNNSEIARKMAIDRKTVAKYRKVNSPPRYADRNKRTREDPFLKFETKARALLEKAPELSATEVYLCLKKEGYRGSERTIQRRIPQLRVKQDKERFFEQVYEAGEQTQFDFKEKVEISFVDGIKIVHFHFGTLPHSDLFFISAYPSKTFESFIAGIHAFFDHVGGVTKNVRIDNLSPCVARVLKGSKRIYTKPFRRAIDHYGFSISPCDPGKGNQKGDVEREIRSRMARIRNLIKLEDIGSV